MKKHLNTKYYSSLTKAFYLYILAIFASISGVLAYDPPKGIPNPSNFFGAFGEIDQPTPSWPSSWLSGTKSDTSGYYYVDKTHSNSTDSGNPYGNPDKPRKTFPEGELNAGTYIYIHAGVYDKYDSGGDRFDWHGIGTAQNPIWITGNPDSNPVLTDKLHIGLGGSASFIVVENIKFGDGQSSQNGIGVYPQTDGDNIDHILIRYCEIEGTGTSADGGGIGFGISQTNNIIPNSLVSYGVFYDNVVHNQGDRTRTDEAGFYCGFPTNMIWCLDNEIFDVASDSIAGSHYSNRSDRPSNNYFIGRNKCYDNGENGIDLKAVTNAIISENIIYGPFTREQGWGIVLHSGHSIPSAYPTENCWVIFNTIHHVSGGIYISSTKGGKNISIVGNVIYDIDADYSAVSDPINGRAIQYRSEYDGDAYIVNNTIANYDTGIFLDSFDSGQSATVYGNILYNRNLSGTDDIYWSSSNGGNLSLSNNLFYHESYSTRFSGTNKGSNAITGLDPLFNNAPAGDFTLKATSPAIGVSLEGSAYDAFASLFSSFGLSIEVDYNGTPRPIGLPWDLGAFDKNTGSILGPHPPDPSNLEITP